MTLPNIPRKEEDVLSYSKSILDFVDGVKDLKGSREINDFQNLLEEYQRKKNEMEKAHRGYQEKVSHKDEALTRLITSMRRLRKQVNKLPQSKKAELVESLPIVDRNALLPAQARDLIGERIGPGAVKLNWRRPKRGSGGRVIFFEIHGKESTSETWSILDTTPGNCEFTIINSLNEGVELDFKVISKNHIGRSEQASNVIRLIL